MLLFASRLTCQQSSITMYSKPAPFIPDLTIASAVLLIRSSLTLQANLFQEFQPMGGVRARPLDGAWVSCEARKLAERKMLKVAATTCRLIFMEAFYQKSCGIALRCCVSVQKWSAVPQLDLQSSD